MDILDQMILTIRERLLVRPGESIVLSLSGGPDSTCMAHLLARIRGEWNLKLHFAHFNHELRGSESEGDERFVRSLGKSLGVSTTCRALPIPSKRKRGDSLQAHARTLRYEALEEIRAGGGYDLIATGHTRNDRAETLIYNLLRGSGVRGLGGIPIRTGRIIRPILEIDRAEIENFLSTENLESRDDSSNQTTGYDRNRIRHNVIPELERIMGRAIVSPLVRTAEMATDISAFLETVARGWLEESARFDEKRREWRIPPDSLRQLPRAVAREVLLLAGRDIAGHRKGFSFEGIERILQHEPGEEATRVTVSGGLEVRFDGTALRLGPATGEPEPYDVPISLMDRVTLPWGGTIETCKVPRGEKHENPAEAGPWRVFLDAGSIVGSLRVRSREPGDRLRPLGAPGSKKLQDLLVDREIPRWDRDSIPIIADEAGIIWVAGVEIADRMRLTSRTSEILEVAYNEGDC